MPILKNKDYKKCFGEKNFFSKIVDQKIRQSKLSYNFVKKKNLENIYLDLVNLIFFSKMSISGKHRHKQWERGWKYNFSQFKVKKNLNSLVPMWFYANRLKPLRLFGQFIKPTTSNFEYKFKKIFLYYIFSKYFKKVENIYEFGCGTGHDLLLIREIYVNKNLMGLDWSLNSRNIVKLINKKNKKAKIGFNFFNFFDFNIDSFAIPQNTGVLTSGALEQTGGNYKKFVRMLINKKVNICVNIEPMEEFYDFKNKLLDKFAYIYHKKRKYLKGYLNYLKFLEKKRIIKIIKIQRNGLGCYKHESYNYVVWKVIQ